jgi:hypothetical protein
MKAFYIREEIDNKIKYEIHYDTFIMLEEYVHDINYAFCTTPDIAMVIADGDLATARYLVNTYCPSSTFPAGIMPQNLYFMFKTGEGYQFNSVSDQWYDGILTSFVSPLGAGSMIIGSTVNAVGSGFRVVSATTKAEITIAKAAKAAKSMSAWQARTSRAFSLRNTIQACKQTTTVSGRELLKKGVLRNVIGIRNTGIHVFSFTKTNILPDVLLDTSASYFLGPEFGNIVSYLGTLPGYKHAYALVDTAQNFPIGLRALEGHKTEFLNGLEKRLQDSGQTILNKGDDYLDVQLNINGQTINKRFIVYEQKTINGVNNEELTLKHLYDNHNIRGIVPVDLKARILDPSEASIPLDHPLAQFEEALSKSFCNAEGFDQAYAKEYLKEAYGLKSLPYLKAGEFVEINFDISLREVDDLLKKTKSVKETAKLTEIQKLTKIKITNAYLTTLGHIQNREFATATIKLSNGEHRTIVVAGVSHKVSYKDIKQFADDPNMYGAGNWEFVETGIHNHPNSQGYPSGATLKSDWETNCKGLDYCQFPYGKGDITNSITQGQKENVIGTIINGNYREVVYKVPSAKEYQGFLEQASKHDELVQLGQLDEAEKISPWVDGININGNYYGPFHGPLMRKMYGSDWRKLFENLKEPLDNPKFLPGGADYNLRPIGVDLPCGTIRSVKP